jgi:hypothetical protein
VLLLSIAYYADFGRMRILEVTFLIGSNQKAMKYKLGRRKQW